VVVVVVVGHLRLRFVRFLLRRRRRRRRPEIVVAVLVLVAIVVGFLPEHPVGVVVMSPKCKNCIESNVTACHH